MITTNVLQRVFHINYAGATGSAVTIDLDGRQYLVTANHIVEGFTGGQLGIFHERIWKNIECTLIGSGPGEIDIAVIAPPFQLSPTHRLDATMAGITLGQTVFFLGFPYGYHQTVGFEFNRDFPFPLVKSGVLSAVLFDENEPVILLDGHNNPGFSGGPVIYVPPGMPEDQFNIAGIVSAYPTYREAVFDESGSETGSYIENNPGIVIATAIKCAVSLIEENPAGFELPNI